MPFQSSLLFDILAVELMYPLLLFLFIRNLAPSVDDAKTAWFVIHSVKRYRKFRW